MIKNKGLKVNSIRKYTGPIIGIFIACIAITIISLFLVVGSYSFPSSETFLEYMTNNGLMSYYENEVYSGEETSVSKYYKGSSLYDKYYVSYTEYKVNPEEARTAFENNTAYYRSSDFTIEFDSMNDNSGRFHGSNSDSDVYQFYKENRLITIVGKTEYADEIKKLVSDLGL